MFIYHFNRLIHNKIIWGGFAFIIALTFGLSFGSASMSGGCKSDATVGKLNGKPVALPELEGAKAGIRAFERMNLSPGTPGLTEEAVFTQALVRIAMSRAAGRAGLAPTLAEVETQITDSFKDSAGGFSAARYQSFLKHNLRMTHEQFADHIAKSIAGGKLQSIVNSATWISPAETEDLFANVTDRLTIHYAVLKDEFAMSEITASEKETQEYYDNNPEVFQRPAQLAAAYVAIPFEHYYPEIEVTEDDVLEYYEENIEKYSSMEDAPEDENKDDENAEIADDPESPREKEKVLVKRPVEEVTDEITAILKLKRARDLAEINGTEILRDVTADRGGLLPVAERFGVEVADTGLFGSEGPEGFEKPREFAAAMNEYNDGENVFSGEYSMFLGETKLYLFNPTEYVPAHVPPFDEIRGRVAVLATAKAKADAFKEQQEAKHEEIQKGLTAGLSFEQAAMAAGLTATNTVLSWRELNFSPVSPVVRAVTGTAMTLQKGQFAPKPAPVTMGAAFVYLADREPGDPASLDFMRDGMYDEIHQSLTQQQTKLVNSQWTRWFENNLQYKPRQFQPQQPEPVELD